VASPRLHNQRSGQRKDPWLPCLSFKLRVRPRHHEKPATVEEVIVAVEEDRFAEFLDEIDSTWRPEPDLEVEEKREINAAVHERWDMRGFKYSGARDDPFRFALGCC
jgi:hypothetical protein